MAISIEDQLRLELATARLQLVRSQQDHLTLIDQVQKGMFLLSCPHEPEHIPLIQNMAASLSELATAQAEKLQLLQAQQHPVPNPYDLSTLNVDPNAPSNSGTGSGRDE
jgi:hypothetical protein